MSSKDDTSWPEGKTFGELTPAQRRAATERAVSQLQDQLTAAAPGIARVLAASEDEEKQS